MNYADSFADTVPACLSDACAQGRKKCQTPEACLLPVLYDELKPFSKFEEWAVVLLPVAISAGALGLMAFIARQ